MSLLHMTRETWKLYIVVGGFPLDLIRSEPVPSLLDKYYCTSWCNCCCCKQGYFKTHWNISNDPWASSLWMNYMHANMITNCSRQSCWRIIVFSKNIHGIYYNLLQASVLTETVHVLSTNKWESPAAHGTLYSFQALLVLASKFQLSPATQ